MPAGISQVNSDVPGAIPEVVVEVERGQHDCDISELRRSMRQRSMTLQGVSRRPVGLPTALELRKRNAERDHPNEFQKNQEKDTEQTNLGYKVAGLLVCLCIGSFIGYIVAFVVPNPTTRDCMLINVTEGDEKAEFSNSAVSLAVVLSLIHI